MPPAPDCAEIPWVEVVSNDVNRGFARGCNQGAAALGDAIVFLNNDTMVHGGWLDELLAPFVDPGVGAVGPRSNNVSGHQKVPDVPYRADDGPPSRIRRYWSEADSGQMTGATGWWGSLWRYVPRPSTRLVASTRSTRSVDSKTTTCA